MSWLRARHGRSRPLRERLDALKPWVGSAVLLPFCIQFASVDELDILRREVPFFFYGILDTFTLVVHEAGHFFFRFFGHFMHAAGGTLMQLLLPMVLIWHFYRHDYRLGTQLSLLWLGQSCISVSIYAADARKRILPLLGDNLDGHDWHYLLGRFGMLEFDHFVGGCFFVLALLVFAALLVLPRFMWE